MPLDYKITDLNNVPEDLRDQYKPAEGGGFMLDVSGVIAEDEVGGLRSALDKERTNAKTATKELTRYRDEVADLRKERDELLDSSGTDAERQRIKDSYDRKLDAAKRDHERDSENFGERLKKRESMISKLTADNRAESLAGELAVDDGSKVILKKLIRERLRVTIDDDAESPTLVVLDKDFKDSDQTLDQLKTEILEDKTFARLVTDTKGGGGGGSHRTKSRRTGSPDTREKGGTREERQARIAEKYGLSD